MTLRTHLVGAAAAAIAVAAGQSWPVFLLVVTTAVLAAPLPDLDHPDSTYGRHVPLPRVAREGGRVVPYRRAGAHGDHVGFRLPGGVLWHRGPLHSLLVGGLAACALSRLPWGDASWLALGFLVGWLSHLALDGLNVAGQAWLWPLSRRRWRLPGLHLRVGGFGETVVLVACVVALGFLVHGPLVGPF